MKLYPGYPLYVVLVAGLISCSTRPALPEPLESCEVRIEENGYVPGVQPAKIEKGVRPKGN